VSPVKYELSFYIPEDGILHSHRREYLKSQKSRRIRWAGHATQIKRRLHVGYWRVNQKQREEYEDKEVDAWTV
jgi:hypothetical protein